MRTPSKVVSIHGATTPVASARGLVVRDLVHVIGGRTVLALPAWHVQEGGHSHGLSLSACGWHRARALFADRVAAEPVAFSEGALMMAGTFRVLKDDPSGMYYRMEDARLVERFDDIRWTGQLPQTPASN